MANTEEVKKEKVKWYTKSSDFALKELKASTDGLSGNEAEKRLKEYGENILPQKKPKPFILMLLKEFINPIVLILLVAMAFSFIVGELLDGLVILGIIMIDAIIGAIQEKRAQDCQICRLWWRYD